MATVIVYDDNKDIDEFLRESNAIEREFSEEAFEDARKAWDYAMDSATLNVSVVLEIHRILMHRIYPEIAGKLRGGDVWISGQRKKFSDVSLLVWELETVLNAMLFSLECKTRIPFRLAAKCHVLFEECHPFPDGNGRTGRILYNMHRKKFGLPIHVIHVGKEQQEYYSWFSKGV